jgi:quinolinate synthase
MTAQPVESLAGIDILAEIDRLRKERNAVILAHYYQKPEIQDLADFVGDSSGVVEKGGGDRCGGDRFLRRRFMAETAKILSPRQDRRAARYGRRVFAWRIAARPTSSPRSAPSTRIISR